MYHIKYLKHSLFSPVETAEETADTARLIELLRAGMITVLSAERIYGGGGEPV